MQYKVNFFDNKGVLICWILTPRKQEAEALASSTIENVTAKVERYVVQ